MSNSLENCDVRSISIGSKISLLFKESAIFEEQTALIGIVETVKYSGDKNSDFPEILDLLDKIWIQILIWGFIYVSSIHLLMTISATCT